MSQKLQPGIMFPELPVKNEKGERVDITKKLQRNHKGSGKKTD